MLFLILWPPVSVSPTWFFFKSGYLLEMHFFSLIPTLPHFFINHYSKIVIQLANPLIVMLQQELRYWQSNGKRKLVLDKFKAENFC